MKKKKRIDPAIVKAREEKKKKRLEKSIKKLEKSTKQLKPVEEIQLPMALVSEKMYADILLFFLSLKGSKNSVCAI